jgi:hypothetical protein
MSTTYLHTTATTTNPIQPPAFARTRRALIRLQAAHITRKIVDELNTQPAPSHGRQPAFARLDGLTDRYAALGGEPPELLGRRRTFRAFGTLRQGLQARRDEWLRRELDAGQTARAHRHETGGDFSTLP